MAARPQLRALIARIEADGGDEIAVFDRFRAGETIADIMETYGHSRTMFYHWLKAGGEARRDAYHAAKTDSGDAMADKARTALEDVGPVPSSAQVSLAKSKSEYFRWLAAKRNRTEYGDDALVAINQNNLTLGDLHLKALLEHGLAPSNDQPDLDEIQEAEVLAIEGEPEVTDDFEADLSMAGEE